MFLYFSEFPCKEPSQPFFLEISITFSSVEVFVYALSDQKKVYCILYIFYVNLLKIITLRPGNRKQNQDVLSWVRGAGWPGVPARDRQQKHGVFISLCAAKRVAWGECKEWYMLSFISLHEKLPGTGLQETAFHNPPKLF